MSEKKRGKRTKKRGGSAIFERTITVDANSRLSASTLKVDADNPIYLFFYFLIRV
jgi:hypothetical protein